MESAVFYEGGRPEDTQDLNLSACSIDTYVPSRSLASRGPVSLDINPGLRAIGPLVTGDMIEQLTLTHTASSGILIISGPLARAPRAAEHEKLCSSCRRMAADKYYIIYNRRKSVNMLSKHFQRRKCDL